MDPPRDEKGKTVPQKSKDPLSLEEEPLRFREPVAASTRREIKNFLEKLTTDVKCEIQFLQDMLDYHSNNYKYPFESSEALENFARDWIGLNISKKEMWTQINKLKEKCEKRTKQFYEDFCFLSADEGEAFELGKKMWSSEIKAIPTEEEPIIASRNPIAIDPPAPFVSSNVPEVVAGVQDDDSAKLENAGLKEGEEEWSPIRSPTSSLSGNEQQGVGPVHRAIGATASFGGLQEEQIIAPRNLTAIDLLNPFLSSNVPEGVGTILGPASSGIGVTASYQRLQEEDDAKLDDLPDDSFLHCNESFHEFINEREVLPSDQPWLEEGEKDLSLFHPTTPFLSSNVPEGVGTILGPASSGIGVTASYQRVQEEDDAKLDDLPHDSFLRCNESFHELINGREVLPSDQPGPEEGEKDLSLFHPTTLFLSSNVPEGDGTILGPESSGISLTALYDEVEREDDAELECLLDESILLSSEIYDRINPLINEIQVFHSEQSVLKEGEQDLSSIPQAASFFSSNVPEVVEPIWSIIVSTTPYGGLQEDEQNIAPRNTTTIHQPTPFLSSNLPEGVGSDLGPVCSGIDVTALCRAMEKEDDIKLEDSIGDSLLHHSEIHALINQSEVLPADQPWQNEGEEDLTTIQPPTSFLLSGVLEDVWPVWREIGVTASHGGLQQEEQISARRNCTTIQLPTPHLSNNVPEGIDTITGFVSSVRGPLDEVQEEKDAELEALLAVLFPNNQEVQTNNQEVLPSYQLRHNEGGTENPTTIQPPTSTLSTSGIETGNDYAANEMGNNTDKESHEEGARIGQD